MGGYHPLEGPTDEPDQVETADAYPREAVDEAACGRMVRGTDTPHRLRQRRQRWIERRQWLETGGSSQSSGDLVPGGGGFIARYLGPCGGRRFVHTLSGRFRQRV